MTQVILVYGPDESCVDPRDDKHEGRRHVDVVEGDAIVIWKDVVGDPDGEGYERVYVWGSGIFENITLKQALVAFRKLSK